MGRYQGPASDAEQRGGGGPSWADKGWPRKVADVGTITGRL